MHVEIEKDSIVDNSYIIEFNDSTYKILNFEGNRSLRTSEFQEWNLTTFKNSLLLSLDQSVVAIKKINDSTLNGENLSYEDVNYKFILKELKWKRDQLYGKWVQNRYYNTTEDFFPPPPPPYSENYAWPPFYEISENKIKSNHYLKTESKIEFSLNNEYIWMNLNNPVQGTIDKWWIESVNDSLLIVYQTLNAQEKLDDPCGSIIDKLIFKKIK